MCNERICGATFSIPTLASKLKEKVAQNPFSTTPPKKNGLESSDFGTNIHRTRNAWES